MNLDELRKLQNTQYEMLKAVVAICEKNNIYYSLAFGTLLGAVRHQGSIPWDNDVDIFIKREQIEEFYNLMKDHLPSNLFCEMMCAGSLDYCSELRIYKSNTEMYISNYYDKSVNNCIRIDVFILDYAKKHLGLAKLLVPFFYLAKLNSFEKNLLFSIHKKSKLKMAYIKFGDFLNKFISEQSFEKMMYKLSVSSKPTENRLFIVEPNKVLKAAWFDESTKLLYEDQEFLCTKYYDEFLTREYGNYMELPPENKRFTNAMTQYVVRF